MNSSERQELVARVRGLTRHADVLALCDEVERLGNAARALAQMVADLRAQLAAAAVEPEPAPERIKRKPGRPKGVRNAPNPPKPAKAAKPRGKPRKVRRPWSEERRAKMYEYTKQFNERVVAAKERRQAEQAQRERDAQAQVCDITPYIKVRS